MKRIFGCLTFGMVLSGFCFPGQTRSSEPRASGAGQATPASKPADNPPPASPDEKAIRTAEAEFVKVYNAGDPKAVAELFDTEAEVVDEHGRVVKGKAAIRDLFAELFEADPGQKIVLEIQAIHFLTPDVALETGKSRVDFTDGSPAELGVYEVLYIKKNGEWRQLRVREEGEPKLTAHERLKELEWLIGDWLEERDESIVHMTCGWSQDKQFLLRTFLVKISGKPMMSGSQRIGWDPSAKRIRSWTFTSEGGFGEGFWSRAGDVWTIKNEDVLRDGSISSATHLLTKVSRDLIRWKAVDQTIGSGLVPDLSEISMVRQPPAPKSE